MSQNRKVQILTFKIERKTHVDFGDARTIQNIFLYKMVFSTNFLSSTERNKFSIISEDKVIFLIQKTQTIFFQSV